MFRSVVARGKRPRGPAATGRRRTVPVRRRPRAIPGGGVRSVARAIDVLFALEHGRQSLADVARSTGLSAVTARRLLASLGEGDLVIHDPTTSTFMLGPGCFGMLDAVVRGGGGLDVIAGPVLARLGASTKETCALYVRAGPRRICAAQVASPLPIRYTARLGMENPIHAGSMGKVLLAFSDPIERQGILDHLDLVAFTNATITDREALERELGRVRRRGYAESRGERSEGVASISAPVFGADGRIAAALSVLGPSERLPDAAFARIRPALLAGAREVGARLAAGVLRRPS